MLTITFTLMFTISPATMLTICTYTLNYVLMLILQVQHALSKRGQLILCPIPIHTSEFSLAAMIPELFKKSRFYKDCETCHYKVDLLDVTKETVGDYLCRATNILGSGQQLFTLSVESKIFNLKYQHIFLPTERPIVSCKRFRNVKTFWCGKMISRHVCTNITLYTPEISPCFLNTKISLWLHIMFSQV